MEPEEGEISEDEVLQAPPAPAAAPSPKAAAPAAAPMGVVPGPSEHEDGDPTVTAIAGSTTASNAPTRKFLTRKDVSKQRNGLGHAEGDQERPERGGKSGRGKNRGGRNGRCGRGKDRDRDAERGRHRDKNWEGDREGARRLDRDRSEERDLQYTEERRGRGRGQGGKSQKRGRGGTSQNERRRSWRESHGSGRGRSEGHGYYDYDAAPDDQLVTYEGWAEDDRPLPPPRPPHLRRAEPLYNHPGHGYNPSAPGHPYQRPPHHLPVGALGLPEPYDPNTDPDNQLVHGFPDVSASSPPRPELPSLGPAPAPQEDPSSAGMALAADTKAGRAAEPCVAYPRRSKQPLLPQQLPLQSQVRGEPKGQTQHPWQGQAPDPPQKQDPPPPPQLQAHFESRAPKRAPLPPQQLPAHLQQTPYQPQARKSPTPSPPQDPKEETKELISQLVSWGVTPEYLVGFGITKQLVAVTFDELGFKLPLHLAYLVPKAGAGATPTAVNEGGADTSTDADVDLDGIAVDENGEAIFPVDTPLAQEGERLSEDPRGGLMLDEELDGAPVDDPEAAAAAAAKAEELARLDVEHEEELMKQKAELAAFNAASAQALGEVLKELYPPPLLPDQTHIEVTIPGPGQQQQAAVTIFDSGDTRNSIAKAVVVAELPATSQNEPAIPITALAPLSGGLPYDGDVAMTSAEPSAEPSAEATMVQLPLSTPFGGEDGNPPGRLVVPARGPPPVYDVEAEPQPESRPKRRGRKSGRGAARAVTQPVITRATRSSTARSKADAIEAQAPSADLVAQNNALYEKKQAQIDKMQAEIAQIEAKKHEAKRAKKASLSIKAPKSAVEDGFNSVVNSEPASAVGALQGPDDKSSDPIEPGNLTGCEHDEPSQPSAPPNNPNADPLGESLPPKADAELSAEASRSETNSRFCVRMSDNASSRSEPAPTPAPEELTSRRVSAFKLYTSPFSKFPTLRTSALPTRDSQEASVADNTSDNIGALSESQLWAWVARKRGVDPKKRLCRSEVLGRCNDSSCKDVHFSSFTPTDEDLTEFLVACFRLDEPNQATKAKVFRSGLRVAISQHRTEKGADVPKVFSAARSLLSFSA